MNRSHIIMGCLILMGAMLAMAWMRPEPATGHGVTHPVFSSMHQGGETERHDGLWIVGWAYGTAQLVLLAVLLTLGLRVDRNAKSHWSKWIGAATLVYLVTFAMLIVADGAQWPGIRILFGLPVATALLVFGMWVTPLFYAALYVWNFRRWVFDAESAARFEALKARYRREQADE